MLNILDKFSMSVTQTYFNFVVCYNIQGCQNPGFCFRSKKKSKIDNRKITTKIRGFYSTTFIESM